MSNPRASGRRRARTFGQTPATQILGEPDMTLLDVIDNVLNRGVVLTGEATLGIASVDLIYLRLSVLLCAADRLIPAPPSPHASKKRKA